VGFLSPLFLALGSAAAIPLLIHLMRRRTGVRIMFPAARYLIRAEQEHSRRLKLRNLLLMVLRVLAVLCIALAAARPVSGTIGRLIGAGHGSTAVALVLDNSLSTSVIVGGKPVLDQLKAVARGAAAGIGPTDRIWLLTANGRTHGGSPAAVSAAIGRTTSLAGAGDLSRAVKHGAALVRSTGIPDAVVAVVTDGQATTWSSVLDVGGVRVVAYAPDVPAPANRAVIDAEARPARWTPRGEVAATVIDRGARAAGDSVTYRIVLSGRTLARGTVATPSATADAAHANGGDADGAGAGSGGGGGGGGGAEAGIGAISVHASPAERGWVAGSVELEPDELRGDDARYFALWIGEAPVVAVDSSAGPFLSSAVQALEANGRLASTATRSSGRTVSVVAADRLTSLPALITAPSDPVKLGAANRALERAGIPWRFSAQVRGAVGVDGIVASNPGSTARDSGAASPSVTASIRYPLVAQVGGTADTLLRAGGLPWLVAGPGYVIIASPMDVAATTWPLRATFVPWIGDLLAQRLSGSGTSFGGLGSDIIQAAPGGTVRKPPAVEEIEGPDSAAHVLSGTTIEVPAEPGVYFLRRGGSRVGALVVNPEARESDLARLPLRTLATRFRGKGVSVYSNPDQWAAAVFDARAGRPLGGLFLVAALLLVLAESVATRGHKGPGRAAISDVRRAA
jgi:hypothetical protein